MKFITEPLDCGTGNEYGSFQNVGNFSIEAPSDSGDKSVV